MVSPGNVIAQSMLDRSRIALCMMMLAIFAFNPFGKFLSHADSAVSQYNKPSGRAILGAGESCDESRDRLLQHKKTRYFFLLV